MPLKSSTEVQNPRLCHKAEAITLRKHDFIHDGNTWISCSFQVCDCLSFVTKCIHAMLTTSRERALLCADLAKHANIYVAMLKSLICAYFGCGQAGRSYRCMHGNMAGEWQLVTARSSISLDRSLFSKIHKLHH